MGQSILDIALPPVWTSESLSGGCPRGHGQFHSQVTEAEYVVRRRVGVSRGATTGTPARSVGGAQGALRLRLATTSAIGRWAQLRATGRTVSLLAYRAVRGGRWADLPDLGGYPGVCSGLRGDEEEWERRWAATERALVRNESSNP